MFYVDATGKTVFSATASEHFDASGHIWNVNVNDTSVAFYEKSQYGDGNIFYFDGPNCTGRMYIPVMTPPRETLFLIPPNSFGLPVYLVRPDTLVGHTVTPYPSSCTTRNNLGNCGLIACGTPTNVARVDEFIQVQPPTGITFTPPLHRELR
jgi:hypothetical protein